MGQMKRNLFQIKGKWLAIFFATVAIVSKHKKKKKFKKI